MLLLPLSKLHTYCMLCVQVLGRLGNKVNMSSHSQKLPSELKIKLNRTGNFGLILCMKTTSCVSHLDLYYSLAKLIIRGNVLVVK
jgi:hypothetical protein